MAEPRLENDNVVTNPPLNTEHHVTADVAQVNVFFDGTRNNYYNVEASAEAKAKHKDSDSYTNDKSNVSRMWEAIKKFDILNPVYVEGMGTSYDPEAKGDDRYKDDSWQGYGFGQGESGVEVRAKDAFRRIMNKVNETRRGKLPLLLEINVFGFSRGAAAARHFIHLLMTDRAKYFNDEGWKEKGMVQFVNFVGLFDTVSSVGYNLNFNDVKQLNLEFEEGSAEKVFHLCAGDEYRKNFSLTTIQSATQQSNTVNGKTRPVGYELTIPGAHSDVGGGYHDIEPESRSFEQQHKAIVQFIEHQGWYNADQCQGIPFFIETDRGLEQCIHYRMDRDIKSDYYKVGLTLMVEKVEAHDKGNVPSFSATIGVLASNYKEIEDLRNILRQISKREIETTWGLTEHLGQEKARSFRGDYLHMSFNEDSMGMGITSNLRRTVYQG